MKCKVIKIFMIIRKYILANGPILTRDINQKNLSYQIIFDNEKELVKHMLDRYFANPMEIALIECELYDNTFRDIKEICGFRKSLQEEINNLKEKYDL